MHNDFLGPFNWKWIFFLDFWTLFEHLLLLLTFAYKYLYFLDPIIGKKKSHCYFCIEKLDISLFF